MAVNPDDKNLALFCDFENIALGVRDARYRKFNIQHVLERLLVKGSIVVKKAYCDWERYKEFKGPMHEASFELIEIPHVRMSGKNSADIRLVVDALDLCYTKSHVDTFVIISGDSDFSPLVSKLRENAKTVIGVGVKNSTSDLLINNCDEFIYYDDLVRELEKKGDAGSRGNRKRSGSRGGRGRRNEHTSDAEVSDEGAGTTDDGAGPEVQARKGAPTSDAPATRQQPTADAPAVDAPTAEAPATDVSTDAEHREVPPGSPRKPASRRSRGKSRREAPPVDEVEDDEEIGVVVFGPVDDYADDDDEGGDDEDDADDNHGDSDSDSDSDSEDSDGDGDDDLQQEGIDLIIETATALASERGGKDKLWGSMIKQALKRRRPGFNESYYGFDSFSSMLEEAESHGLLKLEPDERSGGYIIRDVKG